MTYRIDPERKKLLSKALIDLGESFQEWVDSLVEGLLDDVKIERLIAAKKSSSHDVKTPEVPAPEVLLAEVGQEPEPATDPLDIPGVSKGLPPNFDTHGPSPSGQVKPIPKGEPQGRPTNEVKQEKKLVDSFDPDDTPLPRGF